MLEYAFIRFSGRFEHKYVTEPELKNIQIVEAMDILNSADSRMKLLHCNDVVLVEEKSKSKYSDIDEELNVLSSMNKNVVGVILL